MMVDMLEFDQYLVTSADGVWREWVASGQAPGPQTPRELSDQQIAMVIAKFELPVAEGRVQLAALRVSSVQFWTDTLAAYTTLTGEAPELDPDLPVVPVEEIALLRITRRLP